MTLSSLTGHATVGSMSAVNLALCSVNLAEAAHNTLPQETLAEIFATAALALRVAMHGTLQIFSVSTQHDNFMLYIQINVGVVRISFSIKK